MIPFLRKAIKDAILEDNKKKYYVGKLIFDTKNINPATYLGFGTWTLWGAGRVPVGVDTSQTEFNSVEKTGGAKTVTLTTSNIPKHTHKFSGTTSSNGSHNHTIKYNGEASTGGNLPIIAGNGQTTSSNKVVNSAGSHTHTISGTTGSSGSGTAHNNLQPYITCYIWKRTA